MATWLYLGLQDSASPFKEKLTFHDHIMVVLILIITSVGHMMSSLLTNKMINWFMLENRTIYI